MRLLAKPRDHSRRTRPRLLSPRAELWLIIALLVLVGFTVIVLTSNEWVQLIVFLPLWIVGSVRINFIRCPNCGERAFTGFFLRLMRRTCASCGHDLWRR